MVTARKFVREDCVRLCVWVSEITGSFAEDVIFVETDLSTKLLEGVLLRATTVWVEKGVIDKLSVDNVIFSDERTDVGVTDVTFVTKSILTEATDILLVNMKLLLFILGVTATEFEVNKQSLKLEINVGNGLSNI